MKRGSEESRGGRRGGEEERRSGGEWILSRDVTYGDVSSLSGEVGPRVQQAEEAGCCPLAVGGAPRRHLVQLQPSNTAHHPSGSRGLQGPQTLSHYGSTTHCIQEYTVPLLGIITDQSRRREVSPAGREGPLRRTGAQRAGTCPLLEASWTAH